MNPTPTPAWRGLAPIGGIGALAAILPPISGLLVLGTLPTIGPWLQGQHWLGLAIYIAAFMLLAGLALLPTYAQAMLGGWAFGFGWGYPAALAGFAGGSMLAFWLGRSIAGSRLLQVVDHRPHWRAVHDELVASHFWRTVMIVTLLRLPPTSPFALTNVLLASTRVAWGPYLVGTILGLAPRTAMAVFAAAGLSQLDLSDPVSASNWTIVLGIGATVLMLAVIGLFARRALRRVMSLHARS